MGRDLQAGAWGLLSLNMTKTQVTPIFCALPVSRFGSISVLRIWGLNWEYELSGGFTTSPGCQAQNQGAAAQTTDQAQTGLVQEGPALETAPAGAGGPYPLTESGGDLPLRCFGVLNQ